MKNSKKILIGGQALAQLGSSRSTKDTDYLVCDESNTAAFIHEADGMVDYINAAGNEFFMKIWEMEANNASGIASLKALVELKAYAFVQHCCNRNFKKADEAEFDIKFLIRKIGCLYGCGIAKGYMTAGQYSEICKIIRSVKF